MQVVAFRPKDGLSPVGAGTVHAIFITDNAEDLEQGSQVIRDGLAAR